MKTVRLLTVLSAYCMLLLVFRVWMTGTIFYGFLVWNLFLAYVPFALGKVISSKELKKPFLLLLVLAWVLFLPNAPYIITDIFHLRPLTTMPIWFDLLLVISFAFNGMLVFFLSVNDIYRILGKNFSMVKTAIITTSIFFLTGFGVYLGRFLRFNSWDIASNPKQVVLEIIERVLQPVLHLRTWGFTLGFGMLFLLGFLLFKSIVLNEEKNKSLV